MTTETKATTEMLMVDTDPDVRVVRHAVGTARDRRDGLAEQRAGVTSRWQYLKRLTLDEALEAAEATLDAATRAVEPVVKRVRATITERRRPGRVALLRALREAAEHTRAASLALAGYDAETSAACGVAAIAFPAPLLLVPRLAEAIEQLGREIDGPKKKTRAPAPRPGEVRVRVVGVDKVFDRDWNAIRLKGDVFDLDEKDFRRLQRESPGAVEVVEVKSA